MRVRTALLAGLIGLFGSVGQLTAQTGDQMMPSAEGVCDGLRDATPGLFGLSLAYCGLEKFSSAE